MKYGKCVWDGLWSKKEWTMGYEMNEMHYPRWNDWDGL